MVGGRRTYEPFNPQPADGDVFTVQHYYTSHMGYETYKKRVSRLVGQSAIGKPEVALVEYKGAPLLSMPHGNKKDDCDPFVRTPQSTMDAVSDRTKTEGVKVMYDNLISNLDIESAPRDSTVVWNKAKNERAAMRHMNGQVHCSNFADQIQHVFAMIPTDDFIRTGICTHSRVPQVVLYTQRQLDDLKAYCFNR